MYLQSRVVKLTRLPCTPKNTAARLMSGLPYRCPLYRHMPQGPSGLPLPLHVFAKVEQEKLQVLDRDALLAFLKDVYSDDAINKIEEITRGQASEPLWHLYRKGMLSASIGHACLTRISRAVKEPRPHNARGLMVTLMQQRTYTSEVMRRGVVLESEARSTFCDCIRSQGHDGFIMTCGFLISKPYPFIGCSVDGIFVFTCKCCEGDKVLLEIKCPKETENAFSNKECREAKAHYRTQMNVQMGITEIHRCHFFMYHVNADQKDWRNVIVIYSEPDFINYCNVMTFLFHEYLLSELVSD